MTSEPDAPVRLRNEVRLRLRPRSERLDRIADYLESDGPDRIVTAAVGIRVEASNARIDESPLGPLARITALADALYDAEVRNVVVVDAWERMAPDLAGHSPDLHAEVLKELNLAQAELCNAQDAWMRAAASYRSRPADTNNDTPRSES